MLGDPVFGDWATNPLSISCSDNHPNSTYFHVLVFGAWLCEAIVSLGDPDMSVFALETQIKDTNANFVICYEGSRKNVYEALKNANLLEKIKVIVLELVCPVFGQDEKITEPNFVFFEGGYSTFRSR